MVCASLIPLQKPHQQLTNMHFIHKSFFNFKSDQEMHPNLTSILSKEECLPGLFCGSVASYKEVPEKQYSAFSSLRLLLITFRCPTLMGRNPGSGLWYFPVWGSPIYIL